MSEERVNGNSSPLPCCPSVKSRWDGEKLIWTIEDIDLLDSDLKAWAMRNMPEEWMKPHDGCIRNRHISAWWEAWCRSDHLKMDNAEHHARPEAKRKDVA